ncbi:MAG TPA: hypothetical protein VHU23_11335 [Rhizomicrobium sp.]|jgi:uncharacterized membrane protein YgcG|nr:hypothetical protein [Rhizomicrobium sp.]
MGKDGWSLAFPLNTADESEGLGNAGIETFRDSPYASTARECGQNSKDAGVGRPVRLTFDVLDVARGTIPSIATLTDEVRLCLQAAKAKKDEKEIEFFQVAQETLSAENLRVLRIEDFNTKGLIGPCEEGNAFHALLKADGVTVKDSSTAGGSFGIGKNAVFAVSDLQTVFYSTVYADEESGTHVYMAQGKTKLVSHRDRNGDAVRQTGYWGNPTGFRPVTDPAIPPAWMHRTEIGTSAYVIGFREVDHWDSRVAYSVLQNFFAAIHRGDMSFLINNGKIRIDRLNLEHLFQDSEIIGAAEEDGHKDDFDLSADFLECLTSAEAEEEIFEIRGLGKISFRILVKEGLPKRVAIIRNGMLITTDLQNFNDRFQRFHGTKDFIAIVEPVEDEGRTHFKRLENPRHNELSAERISNKAKRDQATRSMRELAKRIRDTVKQHAAVAQDEASTIDELARYFAAGRIGQKSKEAKTDDDLNTIIYAPKETPRKPPKRRTAPGRSTATGEQGDGAGDTGGGGGDGESTGGDSRGGGDYGTGGTGTGAGGGGNKQPTSEKPQG